MSNFQKISMLFLTIFIGLALSLIFINSMAMIDFSLESNFILVLTIFIVTSCILSYYIINSNYKINKKIIILLVIATVIRVFWIVNVNSIPVSDFNTMYLVAKELLNKNFSAFRGYGYLSRFPHLVCMTLYMAFMINMFPKNHLIAMKIVNLFLSIVTIVLLYNISKKFVKNEKIRLGIILISAIFPPFIAYSSTYCTENLAIPLYLLTMLAFFEALKDKSWIKWSICGVLLGISELFRGVSIVFLIAFLIYIFIFIKENRIKNVISLISGMVLISFFVSFTFMSLSITDKPLWKGAEPSFITLLLKGSNVVNGGRWNLEDATFIDENINNSDFKKQCIKIVINRIGKLSFFEKVDFFVGKFLRQWCVGDCSGTYWATLGTNMGNNIKVPLFQIIFCCIIFLSLIALVFNRAEKHNIIFYIILCGFIILFMIAETQGRYSYIVSWIFLILATQGIEKSIEYIKRKNFIRH